MVRHGLSLLGEPYDDFEVVGQAANGVEALHQCRNLHPQVVLMDASMPHMDGIDATRIIAHHFPETRVIMMLGFQDANRFHEALAAGAACCLMKNTSTAEIISAIRSTSASIV